MNANNSKKVVVVLAHEMDQHGRLNQETTARVDLGVQRFEISNADYLMFVGWDYRPDSQLAICDAMNEYQKRNYGIDQRNIILNRHSRDTVGDAIFSRIQLDRRFGTYQLEVVSSSYHLDRVKAIFTHVHGPEKEISFFGADVTIMPDCDTKEKASLAAFRTTFKTVTIGDIDAHIDCLVRNHPFYNGEVHPVLNRNDLCQP